MIKITPDHRLNESFIKLKTIAYSKIGSLPVTDRKFKCELEPIKASNRALENIKTYIQEQLFSIEEKICLLENYLILLDNRIKNPTPIMDEKISMLPNYLQECKDKNEQPNNDIINWIEELKKVNKLKPETDQILYYKLKDYYKNIFN
ncbi:hypothetical protein [Aquimarina sp. RZ0]|uniref:hypothetical protein n=1 Tax=Aquimarina sp. RZ0 TaxID=2607730 RepID=UPI0011F10690|nr:hypothetical protein [Aquimarina sp. RZ0]KAA1247976.1 hypothetical protein F0000_01790 [Aquimarina sp. RZ0]